MTELRQAYEQIFTTLSKQYYVDSLLTADTSLIFILESPHIQEVAYGVPVAGPSGATMSKHLFGPTYNKPLGRLLKKNTDEDKNRPSLNTVGLMNVSGIPMQRKAYQDDSLVKQYASFFDVMEGVRKNNHKRTFREDAWNVLQEMIIERFQQRLQQETERPCTLVPCGRFAQKFFRLADIHSEHWQVISQVPHPSYNSWDRERYQEAIQQVKTAFQTGRANIQSRGMDEL